jgi:hypothetical protein
MYKQLEYLREGVTMTRGQTYKIDLPETGMVSGLFLKLSAPSTSNATLAATPWRLQDLLGTLEVIANGSTIIKSADWKNFSFLHFLKSGVGEMSAWRNYATNTQFENLLVLFGRSLWDPDYGLDLSKYDNVEFRLTNSSSATYHSDDITASLMLAYLREHTGGFRGHIRTEKWREWTTVANETKYFTLPTEFPYCGIYLRALPDETSGVNDTGFANLMSDIDFKIGGGTKQVYKGGLDDLALMNYYELGKMAQVGGLLAATADHGFSVSLGRVLHRATASGSKDGSGSSTVPTIEADETDGYIKPESAEADSPIEFIFEGYGYQYSAWLHRSPELAPDTLLVPQQAGEITLNVMTANSASAADGTNQVILERVVS